MSVKFQVKQYRNASLNLQTHFQLLEKVFGFGRLWPNWEVFPDGSFFVSQALPLSPVSVLSKAQAAQVAVKYLAELKSRALSLSGQEKNQAPFVSAFRFLQPGEVEAVEDEESGKVLYHHVFFEIVLPVVYGSVMNDEPVELRNTTFLKDAYVRVDVLNQHVWGLIWKSPVFTEVSYLRKNLEAENKGEFSAEVSYEPLTQDTGMVLKNSESGVVGSLPLRTPEQKIAASPHRRFLSPLLLNLKPDAGENGIPSPAQA